MSIFVQFLDVENLCVFGQESDVMLNQSKVKLYFVYQGIME